MLQHVQVSAKLYAYVIALAQPQPAGLAHALAARHECTSRTPLDRHRQTCCVSAAGSCDNSSQEGIEARWRQSCVGYSVWLIWYLLGCWLSA